MLIQVSSFMQGKPRYKWQYNIKMDVKFTVKGGTCFTRQQVPMTRTAHNIVAIDVIQVSREPSQIIQQSLKNQNTY
jgi:hypothetical protein